MDHRRGQGGGRPSHRGKAQREKDFDTIARMDRRGYTHAEIAKRLGITRQMVDYEVKRLKERYRQQSQESIEALIEERRAQYREVRKEAWRAWVKSRKDFQRLVEEERVRAGEGGVDDGTADGSPVLNRVVRTTEGRLPDPSYLKTVIETLRDESELLGLNQPRKLDVRAGVVNWDRLFVQAQEGEVDGVEKELARIEAQLAGRVVAGSSGQVVDSVAAAQAVPEGPINIAQEPVAGSGDGSGGSGAGSTGSGAGGGSVGSGAGSAIPTPADNLPRYSEAENTVRYHEPEHPPGYSEAETDDALMEQIRRLVMGD